jgi:hypothetical protein
VNMVQILWTHEHKWNKDGSWNYSSKGTRGRTQVWCISCVIRTFVRTIIYPYPAQQNNFFNLKNKTWIPKKKA